MQHRLSELAKKYRINLSLPFEKFPARRVNFCCKAWRAAGDFGILEEGYESSASLSRVAHGIYVARDLHGMPGQRLRPSSLAVRVKNFRLPSSRSAHRACAGYGAQLEFHDREMQIAGRVLDEIRRRLEFCRVGLDYLSLERSAANAVGRRSSTHPPGHQIGSKLRGVLYVLDEPSIGLHRATTAGCWRR